MEFDLVFEGIDSVDIDINVISNWLEKTIVSEGKEPGAVTVIICSDDYLLSMNQSYLKHDYYTDIITFNYNEDDYISGDLFISLDRIIDNAKQLSIDWMIELNRVIVHGVLHLIGYQDHSEDEKKLMRSKEDYYLAYFA